MTRTIARRIVGSLSSRADDKQQVLEIGPGMGVLTKFLMDLKGIQLKVIEIDRDSVAYLKTHYPALERNRR